MSDSETSSDLDIKLIGDNKSEQKKSSDTDYYFNMIANSNKTVPERQELSSSTEIASSDSDKKTTSIRKSSTTSESSSSSTSSRSKNKYTSVNLGGGDQSSSKSSNIPVAPPIVPTIHLSPQEIRMKKIEMLRKLAEIKKKGFDLSKDYDFNSSLEEMEYEYELLKTFVDKRNGVNLSKMILLNSVTLIEWLNEKYDPFDFHLQGWGEHMHIEVDSYNDVLEELYEKYKGNGKQMAPEVKLILLLTASAATFHFSKSQSSIPGLDQVISKNPDLISKLINPPKQQSQFMTPQEINIQKQRELIQQKERELKQKMATQKQNSNNYMQPPQMPQPMPTMTEPAPANQSSNKITSQGVPEIRAPGNAQEIIARLRRAQANVGATDTQDETSSNNDRLLSEGTISETKRGRKPMKPPSISIKTN